MSKSVSKPDSAAASDTAACHFIVATSLDKADAETRRLIRSHVMRGKNKGKTMAPRPKRSATARRTGTATDPEGVEQQWVLATPRQIVSDLSLFRCTADLTPDMKHLIHKAFTVIKPATYAVKIFGIGNSSSDMYCFRNLSMHPAMVPSLLFAAQAFRDMSLGVTIGSAAQAHLARALHFLQRSICDRTEGTSYATMVAVTSLASASVIMGDLETAAKHMDGLQRILDLRGGIESLPRGDMVEFKATSIDLGLAIGTGSKPRFLRDDISWDVRIARGRAAAMFPELKTLHPRPDRKLLNVWADLRTFAKVANDAVNKGEIVPAWLVTEMSTSVPYRLVHLRFDPGSSTELLRLCMLAYTKSLLIRLPGIGRKMRFLADQLGAALRWQLLSQPPLEDPRVLLWALFITAVSIFEDLDDGWLRLGLAQTLDLLGLQTWAEASAVLKGFLWVDVFHDQPAERFFEQLQVIRIGEDYSSESGLSCQHQQ